ncbi:MAG: hypothetical protein CM15mP103_03820 [Gammaproteobacteria bacterium]|nr:MAG: hypothetical protein CM15mP103_03820 [Gammaproteobacteria bacterium]
MTDCEAVLSPQDRLGPSKPFGPERPGGPPAVFQSDAPIVKKGLTKGEWPVLGFDLEGMEGICGGFWDRSPGSSLTLVGSGIDGRFFYDEHFPRGSI